MTLSQKQIENEMRQDAHSGCDGNCQMCKDAKPQKGINQEDYLEVK